MARAVASVLLAALAPATGAFADDAPAATGPARADGAAEPAPAEGAPAASLASAAPASAATSPDGSDGPRLLGRGGLPGGRHVAGAEALPVGSVGLALLSGFGRKAKLLGADHRFVRGAASVGVAYQATAALAIAASFDGRYDRHFGLAPSGDDGWVGDPRLLVRGLVHAGRATVGGEASVWLPGQDAPSVRLSATTVEARLLGGVELGAARVDANLGVRLDRSARSVAAPATLSVQDQVSLGVSAYDAVLGGVRVAAPAGPLRLSAEASAEHFLDGPGQLLRLGGAAGLSLGGGWVGMAYAEVARDPSLQMSMIAAGAIPLVPYEAGFSVGVGLAVGLGGPRGPRPAFVVKDNPGGRARVELPRVATLDGVVVDEAGAPVVGAKVTVTVADKLGEARTDDKGAYHLAGMPLDAARIDVEVDGRRPGSVTLALREGANEVPPIRLEAALPDGQIRGIVRAIATGKPVVGATIELAPGGAKVTTGADGTFVVNVRPGQYHLTVAAPGLAPQALDATVDANGVSIKNIDLRR